MPHMATIAKLKLVYLVALVILIIFSSTEAEYRSFNNAQLSSDCTCYPVNKDFNETITDAVNKDCRKCYVFSYNFTLDQNWAANVWISSKNASQHKPLLIVVRESLSVMSFQVPQTFDGNSFSEVNHTLCPLANYFDKELKASKQDIFVEISSQSDNFVGFEMKMVKDHDFVIVKEKSLTFNITPSQPRVMQYNMEKDLRAVRIEAQSSDESCMILAIQNIQCPFYDSEQTVEHSGFYQTLMKQSGIAITKETFSLGRLYIVLILKPSNADCIECCHTASVKQQYSKEVTVTIVPAITDEEYYEAVFGAFGFYIVIYLFSFIICIFLFVKHRRNTAESKTVDVESPTIQNYGTSSESEGSESSSDLDNRSLNDVAGRRSPISLDETDIDTLPDASVDKNVVRTKPILFVSDLSRKNEKHLSERSKVYSWNLLTIAIFYGLPVIQLVYINQRIVNLTGNQDLCYYNFLCSHQVWVFSDFNHVYSNLGYVMLGILFLMLVCRRESQDKSYMKDRCRAGQMELTGLPHHYGLMYAMGWALIMEGVLSASYHVCPNRANFQFDTAFMYVIATIYMLKLYQSRHPDITAKSHTTWTVLSIVVIIGVGGVLKGGTILWLFFVFAHVIATFLVSAKIYYMGRCKFNRGLFARIRQAIKLDMAAQSYSPQYTGRFVVLGVAVLLNLAADLFGLIKQPENFGAFLLGIFIMNLLLYLIYYTIMKIRYGEHIRWIPFMYMVLAFFCWGVALYFFLAKNTSWQVTPAESRERNKHCIILNFFDHHDIWHFISSCALFFSFMVLFTLDDDLISTPRNRIIVF
uniref:Putative SID-1 n=1 Tax=Cupiennius salei TaxID=6928 RepID=T1E169_CUPSA